MKKMKDEIMLRTKLIPVILLVSILTFSTGCETHAQKKEAATLRLAKATAKAKVPVAQGLFENGRIDEAEKTISECLEVNPDIAEAHLLMGKIYLARADLTRAADSLNQAVNLDKALAPAWYLLAVVAQQNAQPQKALEYYNMAMSLDPANTDYIIALGEAYAAQGRYDDALNLLEYKTELLPNRVRLKIASADVLSRLGKTEQAIILYNQALLLKSGDPDITEALAYCYIMNKQWDRAAEMFEELTDNVEEAQRADYLQLLALCCMNAGDYSKAFAYYDRLSIDQRDDPELWLQMGRAALGAGASKRAYACAARALTLRPGWPDAVAVKACAQYLNADYTAAVKTFKGITSDKTIGAFAWAMTARCYRQLGQTAREKKAYEKAAQLKPDSELLSLM
jgi:tetratricopeptide (TPR) repeat protein